uniref:Uncharacterized protein n=1 Tax=Sinocyclocheilus grahami TaxID=75366 RepID=A0A672RSM8_SINGR
MLSALILLLNLGGAVALKICSFNIKSFGESKISKPDVLDIIVEVTTEHRIPGQPGTRTVSSPRQSTL